MLVSLLFKKVRSAAVEEIMALPRVLLYLRLFGDPFAFLAATLMVYEAFRLASASLVTAVTATQPTFVLLFSGLFTIYAPRILKEQFDRQTLALKVLAVLLIIAGVWLVSG